MRREIIAHQARVVKKSVLEQQAHHIEAEACAGRAKTERALAGDAGQNVVAANQDALLIFGTLRMRMEVAMVADLVALGRDLARNLGIGFRAMAGDEPGRGNSPFAQHREQSQRADAAKLAARNRTQRLGMKATEPE